MSVTVMKTKAELAIRQGFEAVARTLPGGDDVAALRRRAMDAFEARGLPHRRIEEWKYTDLRAALRDAPPPASGTGGRISASELAAALGPLGRLEATRIVFVDGRLAPELSAKMPKGVEVSSLASALSGPAKGTGDALLAASAPADDAMVALNAALVGDGAIVRVAPGTALSQPIVLALVRQAATPETIATRNHVTIGAGAAVTLIEAHVSFAGAAPAGHANTLTGITVGDCASLAHIKATTEQAALHVATGTVAIGAKAAYRAFHLSIPRGIVRNQVFATFKGEHSKLDISGAFLARGSEHVDTTLLIDHAVPHCESRELFKGVLDGEAKGVFQGKVIVRPNAQKSDGKQMARALLLSPAAEFDSKPELEIYADDVACGHGSTSAEIDQDLLFYCRSRGIPLAEARALLIESFVGEAIEKVEAEPVREALRQMALGWLTGQLGQE